MRRTNVSAGVGGEGSTEQHVERLWSREGVGPLRITKAGVAHERGGEASRCSPSEACSLVCPSLEDVPLRSPWKRLVTLVSVPSLGHPRLKGDFVRKRLPATLLFLLSLVEGNKRGWTPKTNFSELETSTYFRYQKA